MGLARGGMLLMHGNTHALTSASPLMVRTG
jgi:hypothetical protein